MSIATLTGPNGLLTRASEAKIETALGAVKEALKLEQGEKVIDNEKLTPEILLAEGKVTRTVQAGENDTYYMYYAIKENAYEGMQGLGKGNIASLKDVFLIDDNLSVKYIASNGKEYGDDLSNKVLEDETEIRFSSKAFSEYVSKISGVTEDEMKFKWMKNQTTLEINDANVTTLQDLVFFPNIQLLTITGDTNNLESLEGTGNCAKLTSISFYNVDVNSTKGIEECVALKKFSITEWSGTVYNLDGIDKCQNLENIKLERPYKGSISLFIKKIKNLKNLKVLYIASNTISSSDISNLNSNLTNLTLLDYKGDNLSGIENLKNLNVLNISGGILNDIFAISNLSNLTNLNLKGNKISDISAISNLTNLDTLYLINNQVENILPLSENIKLKKLYLKGNKEFNGNRLDYVGEDLVKLNKIGEIIDRGGIIELDVDKLGLFTNYKSLNLAGQNLENIYFLEGLTELTSLDLSNNPSLKIDDERSKNILNSMKKLKSIYLNENTMDISALNTMTWLTEIRMWGSKFNLSQIEDIISNINLLVDKNVLATISECNPSKISKLRITSWNEIKNPPDLSKFMNLKELSIPDVTYDNYSFIENMVDLTVLNFRHMHGKMPDFTKLTALTSLNMSNSYLNTEDLKNLRALKNNKNLTINLENNSIIDASDLLVLDSSCKINLKGNINLSQESKDALKLRFGNNVTF